MYNDLPPGECDNFDIENTADGKRNDFESLVRIISLDVIFLVLFACFVLPVCIFCFFWSFFLNCCRYQVNFLQPREYMAFSNQAKEDPLIVWNVFTRWHIYWDLFKKGQEDDHTNIRRLTFFCAWDLSFLYVILDFWSMSNSQSCLHHCVFVGTFRFKGRFVSWWDFFSSGFVWAVCSLNNFCRGKVWGGISWHLERHGVFVQPPFPLFRWWTIFFPSR